MRKRRRKQERARKRDLKICHRGKERNGERVRDREKAKKTGRERELGRERKKKIKKVVEL